MTGLSVAHQLSKSSTTARSVCFFVESGNPFYSLTTHSTGGDDLSRVSSSLPAPTDQHGVHQRPRSKRFSYWFPLRIQAKTSVCGGVTSLFVAVVCVERTSPAVVKCPDWRSEDRCFFCTPSTRRQNSGLLVFKTSYFAEE